LKYSENYEKRTGRTGKTFLKKSFPKPSQKTLIWGHSPFTVNVPKILIEKQLTDSEKFLFTRNKKFCYLNIRFLYKVSLLPNIRETLNEARP